MQIILALCMSSLLLIQHAAALELSGWYPSSLPLAVKTPYLSTWAPKGPLNEHATTFWLGDGAEWVSLLRVDGQPYALMGNVNPDWTRAQQLKLELTATRTIFTLRAGPVDATLTFFTPISPDNLLRQSLPFSYLNISLQANSDTTPQVELYTEVGLQWVTSDEDAVCQWDHSEATAFSYFNISRVDQLLYQETADRIDYGHALYAAKALDPTIQTTFSSGQDLGRTRNDFIGSGMFDNVVDTNFRSMREERPAFAFTHDFGQLGREAKAVLNVVGHTRDPALVYATKDGMQTRYEYWRSKLDTVEDALEYVYEDHAEALEEAKILDAQIEADAVAAHSEDYAALCLLSARQVMMASEITVSSLEAGDDDVLVFMKEISSNGNIQTTDVIFPAAPFYLYLSPTYLELLLEPSYLYQDSGLYNPQPAAHDIGDRYPNATGHPTYFNAPLPVEESADMIVLALALVQKGLTAQAERYYHLLSRWGDALVDLSLIPSNQLSTDDFQGRLANQTSLALKGLIGIQAMSVLADTLGKKEDASHFADVAADYLPQFLDLAISSDQTHITLAYHNESSWSTQYNLFGDILLGLDFIPQEVNQMQEEFYHTVMAPFGLPLDSRSSVSKTDWAVFAAASMTSAESEATRDLVLSKVFRYMKETSFDGPFADLYETRDGSWHGFRARPVVGAHFALLAHPSRFRVHRNRLPFSLNTSNLNAYSWWLFAAFPIIVAFALWASIRAWRKYQPLSRSVQKEEAVSMQPLLAQEASDDQKNNFYEEAPAYSPGTIARQPFIRATSENPA